ncbi:MAG: RNA methyltransferase [Acidobacteriota bacterium]|nr:RNA methyltransferase [Acidobacteriota bacterium]
MEGPRIVGQLLADGWPVESVLLSANRYDRRSDLVGLAAVREVPLLIAAQDLFDRIAGYHAHRGVLALARRPPERRVGEVVGSARLVLVVEGVNDHENLGALFRNAAAFGVEAVVLDPTTADPLYRRSVRVSVGHVLRVPFARAVEWPAELAALRASGWRVAALSPRGTVRVGELRPDGHRWALVVGSEGDGLSEAALAAADVTVRIPMAPGVDSLNVATAAALGLHRLAALDQTADPAPVRPCAR